MIKRKKSLVCLLLAAVMLASLLSACGEPAPTEPATDAPTAAPTVPATEAPTEAPSDATDDESEVIDMSAFIKAFDQSGAITEQVIYDADGMTVTAVSLRYDTIAGAVIGLKLTNKTKKDILVQADNAAVNDAVIAADFSLLVAAGKTAEGELTLSYPSLALAEIHVIATVEFALRFMDGTSFEVLSVSEPVVITTSAAASYTPVTDVEGQIAYDSKGVRIVLRGLDYRRLFSDSIVLLVYLDNSSDKNVSIQTDVVCVNGYELTSAMTAAVPAGKHAAGIVPIFDMDLEEYGVDEIESLELRFKIIDADSWKEIAHTKLISVEL